MRNIINLAGILLMSILVIFACKEDEIEFKKADPSGGIADTYLKVNANYLDNSIHVLKEKVNIFNNKATNYTVNFTIDESTVDTCKGAVSLASSSFEVKDRETVIDLLKVDFSKIAPGLSDTITLIASSDDINLGKKTSLDVVISKGKIPVLNLGNTTYAYLDNEGKGVYAVTLKVFDVPLAEDVNMPLVLTLGGMVLGEEFDMDTVLHVKKDSVNWHFNLTVDADLFADLSLKTFYLDALEENIPSTVHITLKDPTNDWVGFRVGKDFDQLNLQGSMDAIVEWKDSTGLTKFTFDVPVKDDNNGVTNQDYYIQLWWSSDDITLGYNADIPDWTLYLKKGTDKAKFEVIVYGDKFAAGENYPLWIELHKSTTIPGMGKDFKVNTSKWWATVNIGRKEKPKN